MEDLFSDSMIKNNFFDLILNQKNIKRLKTPLQEQEIIDLQKMLLTPAVHYIHMDTLQDARKTLFMLIESLHHYQNIGYFKEHDAVDIERAKAFNIYSHFKAFKNIDITYGFEEYWLSHGKSHVVWIEMDTFASDEYIKQCQNVIEILQNKEIPVFVLL